MPNALKLRSEEERDVLQALLAAVGRDPDAYQGVLAEWQAYHEVLDGLERQVTGLLDARAGLQARQLAHWRTRTAQVAAKQQEAGARDDEQGGGQH